MATPTVNPESFFSDAPPERIIGVECEYTIQHSGGENAHVSRFISPRALGRCGISNWNKYLSNGGALYIDVGQHLEYDTPECLGPRQAAAADLAGSLLMQQIVAASKFTHRGLYRLTGSYKSPQAVSGEVKEKTSGYHENYLIPESLYEDDLLAAIMPTHLATRVYAMTGALGKSFVLSQKVGGIGGDAFVRRHANRTTHGKKPMCLMVAPGVDTDTVGNKDWTRLEVRFADACHSPTMLYLSLAVTSLVLRMVEHPSLVGKKLQELVLARPTTAAYQFAADLRLQTVAHTVNGKRMKAVDIQEALAEIAAELADRVELPEDEDQAIDLCFYVCDKLRECNLASGEYAGLDRLWDTAAKHRYISRHAAGKRLSHYNSRAVQASLVWDRILPRGGGQIWWEKYPSPVIKPPEIEAFVKNPPPTRAARRAEHIRRSLREIEAMSWAHVRLRGKTETSLKDAYNSSID